MCSRLRIDESYQILHCTPVFWLGVEQHSQALNIDLIKSVEILCSAANCTLQPGRYENHPKVGVDAAGIKYNNKKVN